MRALRRLIGVVALPVGNNLEKNHAIAVDIALIGYGEVRDPLRRHVASSSSKLSEDIALFSVNKFRHAEIGELWREIVVEEDVFGLYIAMDYL